MLNNPSPKGIIFRQDILGYPLLDCDGDMAQKKSVVDSLAFTEFLKFSVSEWNHQMHVCSLAPYIYSLTEIDSNIQFSQNIFSQDELATDVNDGVKSYQPRMLKSSSDIKKEKYRRRVLI